MSDGSIIESNRKYWNDHADLWFGTTALPEYGVRFVTEDDLHLFGDVSGKKMLEICCGSGHSLKYHADRNAGELWGLDLAEEHYMREFLRLFKERFETVENYFETLGVTRKETALIVRKMLG